MSAGSTVPSEKFKKEKNIIDVINKLNWLVSMIVQNYVFNDLTIKEKSTLKVWFPNRIGA